MAFIFNMRSVPLGDSSMHRRDQTSNSSLPAISEDGSFVEPRNIPPIPPRALNRPTSKAFALGAPPRFHYQDSPPAYNSHFKEGPLGGQSGEKLIGLRRGLANNKHVAKRGGWLRLAIIAGIIALCIVGLVVGLVAGLNKKGSSSSKSSSSSSSGTSTPSTGGGASGTVEGGPSNSTANSTFPIGTYTFNTYLSTVATNCTSNPNTWLCYPYQTYAQSRTSSNSTFDWIISPSQKNPNNYTISSTQNYFSLVFNSLTLSLKSAGNADEHYFFQTTMSKPTKPTTQLGSQNVAATCYFNATTFQGYLYTKKLKSYPQATASTTETSENGAFPPWPYAVKIEQVSGSGEGTPTCLDPSGNSLGNFGVEDTTQLCDCLYLNTGT